MDRGYGGYDRRCGGYDRRCGGYDRRYGEYERMLLATDQNRVMVKVTKAYRLHLKGKYMYH